MATHRPVYVTRWQRFKAGGALLVVGILTWSVSALLARAALALGFGLIIRGILTKEERIA